MAAQEILEYYKAGEIPPLERLIQRLLEISWIKKLQFFESCGTLMIGVHGQTTNRYTGTVEISVHHNGIYIVQVYDAKNRVLFWDRNVDIQRIGRILIELIKKG